MKTNWLRTMAGDRARPSSTSLVVEMSAPVARREAIGHFELCLYDLSDPHASHKCRRRAREWLVYWTAELARMVNDGRARPYGRPA